MVGRFDRDRALLRGLRRQHQRIWGGSGGDGSGLSDAERAYQLTDAATMTSVFQGTVAEGMPDIAQKIADG